MRSNPAGRNFLLGVGVFWNPVTVLYHRKSVAVRWQAQGKLPYAAISYYGSKVCTVAGARVPAYLDLWLTVYVPDTGKA
eukprot:1896612-Rhodomonas_salina.1